jgi:uncharacterized lipoprotein YmbA
MTSINWIAAAALAVLLSACSSAPPNNYYLLSAELNQSATAQSPSLGVGPVVIPEYLNRNSLVYQESENQLQVAKFERWAEPLTDGVTRVISMNLASDLGTQNVQAFPWSAGQVPQYGLSVRILTLDARAGVARLAVEWEVRGPADGKTLTRQISQLETPLPAGEFDAAKVAAAYSELLQQLSEQAAAVIRNDLQSNTD